VSVARRLRPPKAARSSPRGHSHREMTSRNRECKVQVHALMIRSERSPKLTTVNLDDLPKSEFGFPGPLRDQLVAAILSGAKTSTSSLVIGYEVEDEPLPQVGQVSAVVDSDDRRVAAIETTEVRLVRIGDVDLQHALDEGEGYESVAQWRVGHEQFWHSPEMREVLGAPDFTVNDDTLMVAERFRLLPDGGSDAGSDGGSNAGS
jgi:uncharacterized protein YhfF